MFLAKRLRGEVSYRFGHDAPQGDRMQPSSATIDQSPIHAPEAPAPLDGAALPPPHGLHRTLSSFGVLLLTLSCLSPALSIDGVGADVLQHTGSGAVGLFVLGLAAALVWSVVYAELGSAYPYSGGDYVGVGAILGSGAGFICLAGWSTTAGPSTAFVAQTLATYIADLSPGLDKTVLTFATLAAALGIALLAVRTSALITGLFLAVEMAVVIVLAVCGFVHPVHGLEVLNAHPMALAAGAAPGAALTPVTLIALALGAVNAVYGTVGGNQAISFGEELKDPHRRMGNVIVAACLLGALATALPVIAVVVGARDLPALLKSPAPLTAFVSSVAGRNVGRAVDVGVALAIFNALVAQLMWCARLFYSLGRDEVFNSSVNRLLGRVHAASGAPRIATWVAGVLTAACCLVPSHLLLVFISSLIVYSFGLVCTAVLLGRRRGLTARPGYWRGPLFPLGPLAGLGLVAAFVVANLADPSEGRPSLLILGGTLAAAGLWYALRLKRRPGGWAPRVV
jgi:amino acid transporter